MSASLNLNIFKGKLAYNYQIHQDWWLPFNLILFLKALLNFYAEGNVVIFRFKLPLFVFWAFCKPFGKATLITVNFIAFWALGLN